MMNLLKFIMPRLAKDKRRIKEDKHFKYAHTVFVARYFPDRVELWGVNLKENRAYFLGRIVKGLLRRIDDYAYYKLPWTVQKGGERLFRELGV